MKIVVIYHCRIVVMQYYTHSRCLTVSQHKQHSFYLQGSRLFDLFCALKDIYGLPNLIRSDLTTTCLDIWCFGVDSGHSSYLVTCVKASGDSFLSGNLNKSKVKLYNDILIQIEIEQYNLLLI